ncbi:sensor histidine kinase [Clostridium sp. OS1-26]|uniref:sensor histidine kinase n=1 Tax=Clostridium sp. OS1-26 TaxID=3070681 RepID=UPI0027E14A10|nr:sensor histidine kinase [Clostridium sp. OS1-26]WML32850.1 sensor histidine kinase [Clostridium sp. OS1-26]
MSVSRKYLLVFKYFLLVSIFIRTYFLYHNKIVAMILLLVFSIILMINDYIRSTKLDIDSNYMYFSLLFTICGAAVLTYFVRGFGTNVYIFFPLVELLKLKGIRLKTLFLVHSLLFSILLMLDIGIPNNWDRLSSLGLNLLSYFAVVSIAYSVKIIRIEKEEVNQLNEKLQLANIKLQQYTLEVEELTASKERTRMAQELHDSVGHSLMALIMHLEFTKKICDTKPEKVKEVLTKSEGIAKSSISSLREAVNLLKEEREIKDFNASIEGIINNFNMLNNIKINFNTDENLDNLSSIIKNSMYKTIKESITNSIKHGKATEINISITREEKCIRLILNDNGVGCNKIVKSNGLIGIENRVTSLNGSVKYFSNDNLGFGIDICIPILTEEV